MLEAITIVSIFLIFIASMDIITEDELKPKSIFVFTSGIILIIITLILSLIF